jgi:hypothetical protein
MQERTVLTVDEYNIRPYLTDPGLELRDQQQRQAMEASRKASAKQHFGHFFGGKVSMLSLQDRIEDIDMLEERPDGVGIRLDLRRVYGSPIEEFLAHVFDGRYIGPDHHETWYALAEPGRPNDNGFVPYTTLRVERIEHAPMTASIYGTLLDDPKKLKRVQAARNGLRPCRGQSRLWRPGRASPPCW